MISISISIRTDATPTTPTAADHACISSSRRRPRLSTTLNYSVARASVATVTDARTSAVATTFVAAPLAKWTPTRGHGWSG